MASGYFLKGGLWNLACFPILYGLLLSVLSGGKANATVILVGGNVSLSFADVEANFAPSIKGSGLCGILYLAEPLDACSPLIHKVDPGDDAQDPFILVIRGGCSFDDKVRSAQNAGFKAAIIYDNEDGGALVAMAGDPTGIKIHAIFVSKASGETMKKYAGLKDMELWIIPSFENSAWSIMAISFISLLAISAVLATCFFVRRHRIRRDQPQSSHVREFHGMSRRLVKAMPSLTFTSALEDNCTSVTCAICLEDYIVGDKLRVLPCCHKFHAFCVDSWLTSWRTFCPVCKRDARTITGNPPPSECTPLLSPSSAPSSTALSSARSSYATSSAIQIAPSFRSSTAFSSPRSSINTSSAIRTAPTSFRSPTPHSYSLSRTPYHMHSLISYSNSPHRGHTSHLVSPHSVGITSLASPIHSQYTSTFIPCSSNASPSYIGSSSRQTFLRHCSDSAASISPLASAQSLPGC